MIEEELRRSNEDLERFAFVVSHDMGEPLRTIQREASEIVEAPQLAREVAGKISEATGAMQRLISDLLTYARLGQTSLESDNAVSLTDVLMWAKTNLSALIHENQAEITSGQLPSVFADFAPLSQLLQNLLTNAIKYRSESPPRIHVSAIRSGDVCTIAVQDNGIGINPADAAVIFAPFKRLHGKKVPGTGIGLSICRRIVERLGGQIWVEPGANGGSIFKFNLPARLIPDDSRVTVLARSLSKSA